MISSFQYKSYDLLSAEAKELFRINPLNPNIKIQILICRPYMFSIEAVGRICWSIN